jgi:hypothetical protein
VPEPRAAVLCTLATLSRRRRTLRRQEIDPRWEAELRALRRVANKARD